MNILLIISRFGIGGIQTFIVNLANELSMRGNNVFIFCIIPELCCSSFNGKLNPQVKVFTLSKSEFIIKLINYTRNSIRKIFAKVDFKEQLTLFYFGYLLKKYKIEVIHNNIDQGDIYCKKAANLSIPFFVTLHGSYKGMSIVDLNKSEIQFIYQKAQKIIYLSNENLKPFKMLDLIDQDSKFVRIFNGMYPSDSQYRSKKYFSIKNHIKFGMIARGVPEKGWKEALEAFLITSLIYNNISLILVADGNYLSELSKSYSGVQGVVFLPAVSDVSSIISQLDVGLLPSVAEEMPYSIIEYLAGSLPVIASNVGAINEMITDSKGNKAGFIIEIEKGTGCVNPQDLANCMMKYCSNNDLLLEHSEYSFQCFKEKFDIGHCVDLYEKLYMESIDGVKIVKT